MRWRQNRGVHGRRRAVLAGMGMVVAAPSPAAARPGEWRRTPAREQPGQPLEVSVADFGAVGAGADPERDTAAFSEAFKAGAGGAIRVPPGRYLLKSGVLTLPSETMLRGAGYGSVLEKVGDGPMLAFAGPRTGEQQAYGAIRDLRCYGNMRRGPLLDIRFANNLVVDHVHFEMNDDTAVVMAEVWDSRFSNCVFEWVGAATGRPAVHIRNTPPDAAGRSVENSNQIHFVGCRWEQFRDGALWLGAAREGNVVNGIYLVNCKMETSHLNGPILRALGATRGLFVQNLYLAVNSLGDAGPAPGLVDLVDLRWTSLSAIHNLHAYVAAPTRSAIRVRACGFLSINAVFQDGGAPPRVGVIDLDDDKLRGMVGQVALVAPPGRATVTVTR